MAKKLQRKFIIIATLAVFVVLVLVITPIDIYVYGNTVTRLHSIATFLVESKGQMPEYDEKEDDFSQFNLNLETRNEIRFFSLVISDDNTIEEVNMGRIAAVTDEAAKEWAVDLLKDDSHKNFINKDEGILKKGEYKYYYMINDYEEDSKIAVFIDCTSRIENAELLIQFSFALGILSIFVFVLLIRIFSRRAMRSFVENYEKQKTFITNASHELKTPLAVISANTEVVEMTAGESEWTQSIKNQVQRMTGLINDLVTLAKADEEREVIVEEFDFSAVVNEHASAFKTVIENDGKKLETSIQEEVIVKGDKKGLNEVVSVLIDNANKYCDEGGNIKVNLKKKGKRALLEVTNSFADGENVDYKKFFDRFYRQDESHNSEKKGYGIGLSLAQSIVNSNKGKISVSYSGGEITFAVLL